MINSINCNWFLESLNKSNSLKDKNRPAAVVLQGKYDATGTFGTATQSLILQIAKTHRVALRVIEDASKFGQSIREACSSLQQKVSILVVMSHGRSDYLRLGEDVPWYRLGWMKKPLFQKKDIVPEDFDPLAEEARIILLSCSSGQGIAQDVSNASKRTVFAPMGFVYDTNTCLASWPSSEIKMLTYSEKDEQHMGIFAPGETSVIIPSIDMRSPDNKESFVEMIRHLREKAGQGDVAAQLKLGSCYLNGNGACQKSDNDALYWISSAAERGHPRAQYVMGCIHFSGQCGLEKSESKAIEWFLRSASQRFPLALFHLGTFYLNGQCGFQQSDENAFKLFSISAKHRVPQADYYLGFMHETGRGTLYSLRHAKNHYRAAADFGVQEAKVRLASLLFQEEQYLLGKFYLLKKIYNLVCEAFRSIVQDFCWAFLQLNREDPLVMVGRSRLQLSLNGGLA